jgi:hypothetical protein
MWSAAARLTKSGQFVGTSSSAQFVNAVWRIRSSLAKRAAE